MTEFDEFESLVPETSAETRPENTAENRAEIMSGTTTEVTPEPPRATRPPGWTVGSRPVALGATLYWTLLSLLVLLVPGQALLKTLLGFPALVLLPGYFLTQLLGLAGRNAWETALYRVGLSLLAVMLALLLGNAVLPLLGVTRPLDPWPLTSVLWLLVTGLGVANLRRPASVTVWARPRLNGYDLGITALGLVILVLSILGAVSLNNGGPNNLTIGTLFIGGAALVFLLIGVRRFSAGFLEFGLYQVSLSLLLMTSLRGWFTTGHDIQRELRVFQLAKDSGRWAIENYRDSYNACLSITLLPTAFAQMFGLPDPYIYKVLFQLLFALVPVGVYLFIRRSSAKRFSLLACTYFLAFPTFFGDMPMLNRQEIGFLYLTCMLLILVNNQLPVRLRQWYFLVFGVGLVISHYSTTYATIAALVIAVALSWAYRSFWRNRQTVLALQERFPRLRGLMPPGTGSWPLLTPALVLGLVLINFMWVNVLTQTSSGISALLVDTIETVTGQRAESEQSSDVGYSIFFAKKFDPQASLNEFADKLVAEARAKAPAGVYYSDETLRSFKVQAMREAVLPPTALGRRLEQAGIDVLGLNSAFRQGAARILQLLILIGLGYYMFSRKNLRTLPLDVFTFTLGSLALVGVIVALPFLSVEYGLLRAFQQALMVLSPFILLGINALFNRFRRRTRIMVTLGFSLVFFFSMTGVVPQLLGGYYPQLHLNNSGKYYDIYYVHEAEVAGVRWLGNQIEQSHLGGAEVQTDVQTDRYALSRLESFVPLNSLDDIYPGLLRKESYVFLGYSHVHKEEATVNYKGDLLTYRYPVSLLSALKDTIYDNRSARVYR